MHLIGVDLSVFLQHKTLRISEQHHQSTNSFEKKINLRNFIQNGQV